MAAMVLRLQELYHFVKAVQQFFGAHGRGVQLRTCNLDHGMTSPVSVRYPFYEVLLKFTFDLFWYVVIIYRDIW